MRHLAIVVFVTCFGLASPSAQAPAPPAQAPLPPALLECTDLATALRTVANNDARLRDWPQIARYREANRAVTDTDVVFMGDSITDSWPQPRFGEFFPGKRYVGRGISAQTTPQMLVRIDRKSTRLNSSHLKLSRMPSSA